jgi:hypothetical protein
MAEGKIPQRGFYRIFHLDHYFFFAAASFLNLQ